MAQDADAMLAAMHLIDVILRHVPSSRTTFVEVQGVEALETICDLPSNSHDAACTEAADMAAELIDDFFDDDDDNDINYYQFADPMLQPAQENGTFVFGLVGAGTNTTTLSQAPAPIFLPNLDSPPLDGNTTSMDTDHHGNHPPSINPSFSGGGILMNPPVLSVGGDPTGMGMGRGHGRGRGRGQVLPAWATRKEQQI